MKGLQYALRCLTLLGLTALAAPSEPVYPYAPSLKLVDFTSWIRQQGQFDRGFLKATPRGFAWPDGTRARFWGVNIANRNLWVERTEIDRAVQVLAASGVNLVRFEALDSKGALLDIPDQPGTRKLNPERLDTLHYWIMRLREKGIYYYLDLIDFREFRAEDGVQNADQLPRAGRPYAVFDPRLIELQKEYARQLLTTVNPYTRLAPTEDPALVLLEICNESGFWLYPDKTDNLIEPYRSQLQTRWNQWLARRYPARETLARAWGASLARGEDPRSGTVRLPRLRTPDKGRRQRDGVEFLYEVERAYFATMRSWLRQLGVKVPITAVVSSDVPVELAAVAAELDFLSENHYADHPMFGSAEWVGKFFYNNKHSLRDDSRFAFAPFTAQLRWDSKPVVIREWASVWPNKYRASSIPEAAAYARLQDFDAMILFGYKTGSVRDRLVEFGYQVDPTVWDLFALGGMLFLRGDVATPRQAALLEYPDDKLFQGQAGDTDLVRLALSLRLASTRAGGKAPGGDVTVFNLAKGPAKASDWLEKLQVAPGVKAQAGKRYTSATSEIVRDSSRGLVTVNTPRTLCIAGELGGGPIRLGPIEFTSRTPVGALMILSLDGEELRKSRRWVAKMVSVAENTGQRLVPAPKGPASFVLEEPGTGPVLTFAASDPRGSVLRLWNGKELSVGQRNGTWECLVEDDQPRFWSDLEGARLTYAGQTVAASPAEPSPFLQVPVSVETHTFPPTFP